LVVGYEKKADGARIATLISYPLGKLEEVKHGSALAYLHGNTFGGSLMTTYWLKSKEEVLDFWKKMIGKPVTFQLDFVESPAFTDQDIEYLKSVGTDVVLLDEILKSKNLFINLNKDLALQGFCNERDYEYCYLKSENVPVEINSLGEALLLMDGRPLPFSGYWMVRGAGLEYEDY
jgi:hypothetical protein